MAFDGFLPFVMIAFFAFVIALVIYGGYLLLRFLVKANRFIDQQQEQKKSKLTKDE